MTLYLQTVLNYNFSQQQTNYLNLIINFLLDQSPFPISDMNKFDIKYSRKCYL